MFKPKQWVVRFVALMALSCGAALAMAQDSAKDFDSKPQYHKFNLKRGFFEPERTRVPWTEDEDDERAARDDYKAKYDPRPFISNRYDSVPDNAGFSVEAPPIYNSGFEGDDSTAQPPDPSMAAGPTDLVITRNTSLFVRDFNGTLLSSTSIATLLGTSQFLSDPHVEYDPYSNRFIGTIIALDNTVNFNNARWYIFFSDNSSGVGSWSSFSISARLHGGSDLDVWADYPHIALTNDAVCVGAIMFATPAGSGDSFGELRFMDKTDVYDGGGIGWKTFYNFTSDGTPDKRIVPCTDNGSPTRFYAVNAKEAGSTKITVREFDDSTGAGNHGATTNLLVTSLVSVSSYAPPPDGRQPSTTANLDNSDCRMLEAMVNGGRLFAVNTTAHADTSGNSSAIKAYKLQLNNGGAPTVLVDDIQWLDGFDYFYPGIAGTEDGDAVIAFTRSSETEFASVRYTGFLEGATTIEGTALAKAGGAALTIFSNGRVRYGDYNTCALDPFDGRNVWFHVEYGGGLTNTTNTAGSWVAAANYKPDYVVTANPSTIQQSDTGTLTANVKRSDTNANVASVTVTFQVNGVTVGSDLTDASGNATINYLVASGTLPTTKTITASVARSTTLNEDSGTAVLTITKADTAIQVSNEVGTPGSTASFTIQLIRTTDSIGLASKTINMTINAVNVGSAVTNASGFATFNYVITNPVGAYNVTAAFAGDSLYNPRSDATGLLTVSKGATITTVTNATGVIGSNVALTANLKRSSDNANLSGKTVSFTVGGVAVGSAATNASGNATLNWVVTSATPGAVALVATFAGDTQYLASNDSGTFNRQSATITTVTNSPSGQRTTSIAFTATIKRTFDNGLLTGRTVNFTVDGLGAGSAVTGITGVATLNYVIPAGAAIGGGHTVVASFAGEAFQTASSGNGNWTVLPPTFKGRVNFLDWVASEVGKPLSIIVRNAADAIVQGPTTVNTTAGGNWSLDTSLPAGTYKVSVKGSHWLRKQVTGVVLNSTVGTTATIVTDLKNGDAVGDNVIDLSDYTTVVVAFNTVGPAGDLNGDGIVDLTDYTIVVVNFNLIGDP